MRALRNICSSKETPLSNLQWQNHHKNRSQTMSVTAKTQNSSASKKLHHWTYNIVGLGPTIEYKKSSSNIIADSLSRLRTDAHYVYDKPLHNDKPIHLDDQVVIKEINIIQTRTQTAG